MNMRHETPTETRTCPLSLSLGQAWDNHGTRPMLKQKRLGKVSPPAPVTYRECRECGQHIAWEEAAFRVELIRGGRVRRSMLLCEQCFGEGAA